MNRSRALGLAWLTACALLSGCFGSNAQKVLPEVQSRAETQLMRGIRAEQKGELREAERLLTEALHLSSSIEDNPARARAQINLARLYRLRHDMAQARESIDAALGVLETGSDFYAEAAQEKALIELPADSASALDWAKKAVAAEKGALLGSRLNLLGRIQMARGDTAAAAQTLKQALERNRDGGLAEEEANSLRMLGILARLEQRVTEAERLLAEALEIDKRIGVSTKVAADLEELSLTALASGATDRAIACLRRAVDVNLGAGRSDQAAANLNTIAEIYLRAGRKQEAHDAMKAAEGFGKR